MHIWEEPVDRVGLDHGVLRQFAVQLRLRGPQTLERAQVGREGPVTGCLAVLPGHATSRDGSPDVLQLQVGVDNASRGPVSGQSWPLRV